MKNYGIFFEKLKFNQTMKISSEIDNFIENLHFYQTILPKIGSLATKSHLKK